MSVISSLGRGARWLRPLMVACAFAASLYAVFYASRTSTFLGDVAEDAIDQRMELLADTFRPRPGDAGFVFVDFDAETLRRLGDPPLIGVNGAVRALRAVAALKPAMVIMDIDLWVEAAEAGALREALATLTANGVPVLLVRSPLTEGEQSRFRPSALDPIVDQNPGLMWVGVDATLSSDGKIRQMTPITSGRLDGRQVSFPSPQLAVLLIHRTGSVPAARAAFIGGVGNSPPICGQVGSGERLFCTPSGEAIHIDLRSARLIPYTMTWPPKASLHRLSYDGADAGAFVTRVPAWALWRAGGSKSTITQGGRIVVIGSSALDRKDFHQTPVGIQPGAFILINAVHAWSARVPPRDDGFLAGLWLVLIATVVSFAISAICLAAAPPRHAKAVRSALPPVLTAGLWVAFYLSAGSASVALIIIQYATSVVLVAAARVPLLPSSTPQIRETS